MKRMNLVKLLESWFQVVFGCAQEFDLDFAGVETTNSYDPIIIATAHEHNLLFMLPSPENQVSLMLAVDRSILMFSQRKKKQSFMRIQCCNFSRKHFPKVFAQKSLLISTSTLWTFIFDISFWKHMTRRTQLERYLKIVEKPQHLTHHIATKTTFLNEKLIYFRCKVHTFENSRCSSVKVCGKFVILFSESFFLLFSFFWILSELQKKRQCKCDTKIRKSWSRV